MTPFFFSYLIFRGFFFYCSALNEKDNQLRQAQIIMIELEHTNDKKKYP